MKYRLEVFNMVETILKTLEALAEAVNHSLLVREMPQGSIEEITEA